MKCYSHTVCSNTINNKFDLSAAPSTPSIAMIYCLNKKTALCVINSIQTCSHCLQITQNIISTLHEHSTTALESSDKRENRSTLNPSKRILTIAYRPMY